MGRTAQEDELFSAAGRDGFTWTVHRAHTVIGHAVGNAMNLAHTALDIVNGDVFRPTLDSFLGGFDELVAQQMVPVPPT